MKFTGERILGKQRKADVRFADHPVRYNFAKQFCIWKKVLDIACGVWYGSDMIADVAEKITWVDVDASAIVQAQSLYHKDNLTYILWDGNTIPLEDESVDVVVSFETIEHIVEYNHFLKEIERVLKKGWVLLMSTPNYRGEIVKNIYHVSNFTTESFVKAVSDVFTIKKQYFQGKHFYPIPWRGILEAFFRIKKDIEIRSEKPAFHHHVSMVLAEKK